MNGTSRFVSFATFATTIGTLRQCEKVGFFVASDLANVNGHGRPFESLKFRCRDCDVVHCEAIPFEDDRDRVNKKRMATSADVTPCLGTIWGLIDNEHNLRAHCSDREYYHYVKLDLEALGSEARPVPQLHAQGARLKLKCSKCGSHEIALILSSNSTDGITHV